MIKNRETGMSITVTGVHFLDGSSADLQLKMDQRPVNVDPSDPNNINPDVEYMKNMSW